VARLNAIRSTRRWPNAKTDGQPQSRILLMEEVAIPWMVAVASRSSKKAVVSEPAWLARAILKRRSAVAPL
jgi:hypothetical protein